MIQLSRRHDRTFNKTFQQQACFLILTRIPYVNDQMPDWELVIFADVRIQTHNTDILDGLVLAGFIVQTHGFISTPVQCIAGMQGTLFYCRMSEQFGFLIHYSRFIEFTFQLNFDLVSRLRYVLFGPLCVRTVRTVSPPIVLTSRTVDRYAHDKNNQGTRKLFLFLGSTHLHYILGVRVV